MRETPMFVTYEKVMAPFKPALFEHVGELTVFGREEKRQAQILPRHRGRIGDGERDWTEPLDRRASRDDYGNYLCRFECGQVVLAHESEIHKID